MYRVVHWLMFTLCNMTSQVRILFKPIFFCLFLLFFLPFFFFFFKVKNKSGIRV
ncbi:hypothetical protein HanPSC8_Chr04g0184821 [Helianthus annuus]|nr:hypothetical protein HanPSC8_Chr04g0184821 [Helianthus annuus]